MLRRLFLALLWLMVVASLIFSGVSLVIASDVTDADYIGIITVTNNSTTTANVSCNVSNLSTTQFITNHFLNSSANNSVLQYAGSDIPFMPGYGTNPWIIWVASIDNYTSYNNGFYTGNVTGGNILYFPGDTGITTPYDASMAVSTNYTITIRGFFDFTTVPANNRLIWWKWAGQPYTLMVDVQPGSTLRLLIAGPGVVFTTGAIASGNHTITLQDNTVNVALFIDGVSVGSAASVAVADHNGDWEMCDGENNLTSYVTDIKVYINGELRQYLYWEYGPTFHDHSTYGNDATPTFRTTTSSPTVSANLTSFGPASVPEAPAWSVGSGADFFTSNLTMSGNFTSNVSDVAYPGKDIIEAVAAAGGTPESLPKLLIPTFIILCCSMMTSAIFAYLRVKSLFLKAGILISLIGFAVALRLYDWWMVFFFICFALFVLFASKEGRR